MAYILVPTGDGTFLIKGLSSDSKPTGVPAGSIFKETNTGKLFGFDGAAWQASGGGIDETWGTLNLVGHAIDVNVAGKRNIVITADANYNFLSVVPEVDGHPIRFYNLSGFTITVKHLDAGGTAGYRINTRGAGDVQIADGDIFEIARRNAGSEWILGSALLADKVATVLRLTVQTITTSTSTTILFTTADEYDPRAWHDPGGANPERITPGEIGRYLVICNVVWAANATGRRYNSVVVNAVTLERINLSPVENGEITATTLVTEVAISNAAHYFTLEVYQDTGSNLNITEARATIRKVQD